VDLTKSSKAYCFVNEHRAMKFSYAVMSLMDAGKSWNSRTVAVCGKGIDVTGRASSGLGTSSEMSLVLVA
jgi:hypothetical protein